MTSENPEMASFFKEVETSLKNRATENANDDLLDQISLESDQCFFVFDFTKNKIVHFGGMKKMFGYDLENIDLPYIFDKLHPDDSLLFQAIIKNVIEQSIKIAIPKYTNVLKLSSRFRKNNGEYIRVLSEDFILETANDGIVKSFIVRYTDVSFLDNSEVLDWWVNTDFLDKNAIVNSVYGDKKDIFTAREKQIVLLILLGSSNKTISLDLNISKHTVATHRKNILSKSNCSDVQELKTFCKKNGVFAEN